MTIDTSEFLRQAAWFAEVLEAWESEQKIAEAFAGEVTIEAMNFAVRLSVADKGEITMWKFKDREGDPLPNELAKSLIEEMLEELDVDRDD